MYRCPKCNFELPANARFCNNCGFNQTNARMASVPPQQIKPDQRGPVQNMSPMQAGPQNRPVMQQPPTRSIQPDVKRTPMAPSAPASRPGGNGMNSGASPMGQMPANGVPPSRPIPTEDLRPVRTNTPQRRVTNSSIPTRPSAKMRVQNMASAAPPMTPPVASMPQTPRPVAQPGPPMQQMPPAQGARPLVWNNTPVRPQQAQMRQPLAPQAGQGPMNAMGTRGAMGWNTSVPMTDPYGNMPPRQESLAATGKAAHHWYQSWRDRQRAEAGPAVGIARGQASVPEPLMAMQHSIARMRAIGANGNKSAQEKGMGFSFWVTILLMLCLVGGLGTYILSTYVTGPKLQTQIALTSNMPDPLLTLRGKNATTTIAAGKAIALQGQYFGANDTITFALDTAPITYNGQPFQVTSSSTGSFSVNISIPTNTMAGVYVLRAQDNHIGKHAFLDIQILPTTTSATNTTPLAFSVPSISFTATSTKNSTTSKRIGLDNTNNALLQWTAVAITSDAGNWLSITDRSSATMNPGENDDNAVGISVQAFGLKVGTYTGYIIFTVNGTQQATLPVSLQVVNGAIELVVNPNPLIAIVQPANPSACQPDTSLTLINLSNSVVNWTTQGDDAFTTSHIHINGQTAISNTLQPGATIVLNISCLGVTLGEKIYHITVYYGNLAQHIPVSIRRS